MTDYKNELIQILDRVFTAGRLAGKEAVPADVWDREIGMNLEAIEALLSQHSKKRELEAELTDLVELINQAILTAVAESKREAYKRGYAQGGVDEILRHEKASNEVLAQLGKEE